MPHYAKWARKYTIVRYPQRCEVVAPQNPADYRRLGFLLLRLLFPLIVRSTWCGHQLLDCCFSFSPKCLCILFVNNLSCCHTWMEKYVWFIHALWHRKSFECFDIWLLLQKQAFNHMWAVQCIHTVWPESYIVCWLVNMALFYIKADIVYVRSDCGDAVLFGATLSA